MWPGPGMAHEVILILLHEKLYVCKYSEYVKIHFPVLELHYRKSEDGRGVDHPGFSFEYLGFILNLQ